MRLARVLKGLGSIYKLFSFSLLVPLLGSLVWDESAPSSNITNPVTGDMFRLTTIAFASTFFFLLLLGFLLSSVTTTALDEIREREGYAIVGFAWLTLAFFGSLPFLLTRTTSSLLSAYFETMSGLTTTGATALALDQFESFPDSIHLWRGTLEYVGGLGIIVLAIAVLSRMTEGAYRLMEAETPGGSVTRLKPKITQTAKALWVVYLSLSGILFLALLPAIHFTGARLSWKEATLDALMHVFTTMSTGGFSNHADSILYYDSAIVTWTITAFMLVAGINFNLFWLAFHGRPSRLWRDGEFRFFLGIAFLAGLAITVVLVLAGQSAGAAIETGFFQAASFITTTGATSADHNAFPDAAKLVLLLLMFTGGCVGSTAGGLKVVRIQLLLRLTRRELDKLLHPHAVSTVKVAGRILPDEVIRRVVVFFFSYLTLVLGGAFVFAFLGMDFMSAVSGSASLVGNVGPAFNEVAYSFHSVPELGKITGILLMWMGRLEIFTALLLFVPATYRE